ADFDSVVGSYLSAYNALSGSNKSKVNQTLALFNLNLADGLSDAEKLILANSSNGLLYDASGALRNFSQVMDFYVTVGEFLAAYSALSSADKAKVDPTLATLGLTLATYDKTDLASFSDSSKGILYDATGAKIN